MDTIGIATKAMRGKIYSHSSEGRSRHACVDESDGNRRRPGDGIGHMTAWKKRLRHGLRGGRIAAAIERSEVDGEGDL